MLDKEFDNPYAAPDSKPSPNIDSKESESILARWEHLRLWYNAALVSETLLLMLATRPTTLVRPSTWASMISAGLAANLCFGVGAVAEFYLVKIGVKRSIVTSGLFIMGLLLSMLLALGGVVILQFDTGMD